MYVDDNDYKDKFKKKKKIRYLGWHLTIFPCLLFFPMNHAYIHTHTYIRIINLIATYT